MVATVATVAYLGLEARAVEVQVQLSSGVPKFTIVGLPDKAVAESRERVRAALAAIGLALPPKVITINLSPADLPKEGSHYDLPIALGLLAAIGATDAETLSHYVAVGELCLDGRIAASPGVLLAAIHASSVDRGLICPAAQGSEAAWAGELDVIAAPDLLALLAHLKGTALVSPPQSAEAEAPDGGPDLAEVKGQEVAKRALEIAAAGGHNLLMSGPPGSGKSLLAACLPGILPPLQPSEALEVSMVASVAGELGGGKIWRKRPFRAPHQRLDAGPGRRRPARAAWRDQPRASRRAVPRRAAGVPARRARFAPPAARDRQRERGAPIRTSLSRRACSSWRP
jgi:magnesium chelatase family protein